ncbi:hypothetical protein ALC56_14823 [Trachymyrmex septentrionalis]|uniref:Uncharacterized protein n=1 Tax=Trachymyrmex septentrionalis TaxID=34720 RepID=A0A195ES60_9HYME|nr:hypothetical protein ALC56_14823 [Trachymyrmex septentrionalis]
MTCYLRKIVTYLRTPHSLVDHRETGAPMRPLRALEKENQRRCHDGNRCLKIEKYDTTSHFELKRAGGGWGRKGKGAKKEEESRLKEQRSRRRTGSTAARRNSSLVKGAIIQGIAPGPQTAHKLWAFNFAILTGRSDECRGERDS